MLCTKSLITAIGKAKFHCSLRRGGIAKAVLTVSSVKNWGKKVLLKLMIGLIIIIY